MIKRTSYNLSENLLTSLSLTFIAFVTYLIFCLMYEVFIVLLCQILINYNFESYALVIEKYSLYINLLGMIFIILPLNLSVKNWYYTQGERNLSQAFIVFSSFKCYFKSLIFCFIKTLFTMLSTILMLSPIACVIAILKFMNLTNEHYTAIPTMVFFIAILLLFLGVIACIINFTKFSFIDYIFLTNINSKNNLNHYL